MLTRSNSADTQCMIPVGNKEWYSQGAVNSPDSSISGVDSLRPQIYMAEIFDTPKTVMLPLTGLLAVFRFA